MKKRALVIVCLALLVTPGFARANAPPSLAEYRRAVEDVILLVERAENEPSASARQSLLNQAADLLGSISHVQLGQGAPVPVDNSALIQELKSQPSDLSRVHARLVALRDTLADPPASPGEADRARLKDLLSRPPFSAAQGPDLLGRLLQAILDFLARLAIGPLRGTLEINDWITLVGLGLVAGTGRGPNLALTAEFGGR